MLSRKHCTAHMSDTLGGPWESKYVFKQFWVPRLTILDLNSEPAKICKKSCIPHSVKDKLPQRSPNKENPTKETLDFAARRCMLRKMVRYV